MTNEFINIISKIKRKLFAGNLSKIDLEYIEEINNLSSNDLLDVKSVENLLLRLGINDEVLSEIPTELHKYCGFGLRYWQYPNQFSQYLYFLSNFNISSYLEIGVRFGGTFIITLEYLKRFHIIKEAIGIDVLLNKSLLKYSKLNNIASFIKIDSISQEFRSLIKDKKFDLAFIDGNHAEDYCRKDFNLLKDKSNIIALHDIVSDACPEVQKVWVEIKSIYNQEFNFHEFTQQYDNFYKEYGKKYFGIGVAVRKIWI